MDVYLGQVAVEEVEGDDGEGDDDGVGFVGDEQFGDLGVLLEDDFAPDDVGFLALDVGEIALLWGLAGVGVLHRLGRGL